MPKPNTYMLSDDYTHLEDKAMKPQTMKYKKCRLCSMLLQTNF